MSHIQLLFPVLIALLFSCREEKKPNTRPIPKEIEAKVNSTKKAVHATHFRLKAQLQPDCIPEYIPPDPFPPFDPDPIDPPGYIPEPVITCVGPPEPFPKTIRDSLVNFPATMASFGTTTTDVLQYIDEKIAGSREWNYLRELGIEGRIFVRLLIDVNGKVREVTFLKFSEKELDILKGNLNNTLLDMPLWSPAKDEKGTAVVSEYTLPIRVNFQ
jgi:hypothetical protein